MTNMTGSKLSIFSHPGKITGYLPYLFYLFRRSGIWAIQPLGPFLIIGLLQDHFHIEAHIGPGQYGP